MSNELAVIERDEPEPSPDALGIHPAWRLSPVDRWEIEHGRVTFYAVVDPRVLAKGDPNMTVIQEREDEHHR